MRIANPCTPVRFRSTPPFSRLGTGLAASVAREIGAAFFDEGGHALGFILGRE